MSSLKSEKLYPKRKSQLNKFIQKMKSGSEDLSRNQNRKPLRKKLKLFMKEISHSLKFKVEFM